MAILPEIQYLRNNPNLKSINAKEYIDASTFEERIKEMQKIANDIIYFAKKYFYIISLDYGKCLINPYPKQEELIRKFTKYSRVITLACRQSGKSTSYSLYVLWYIIINHDKSVLICANRLKTAMQILGRIKMAYEELPIWLKPGIVKWNSTTIQLSNGCKVSAQATSQSSGRGSSINLLLLDEFAFIAPNMQQAFMQSVFPVISSSKTSQVIIVSTPNGTNNEYYRIWSKAINNDPEDYNAWQTSRIDWFDVPGRDEQWKQKQLATFNNDMQRFNQQYGCQFLGSAQTLINPQRLIQFKQLIKNNKKQFRQIQLHNQYQQTKIKMCVPPQKGRAYIIGADPSTGSQSDYHAMVVFDITDIYNIQLVAYFHKNNLPPKYFAYIIAKTATLYNKAYVAIENNGVSYATLDKLANDFEYQNIIHDGGSKLSIGIASSDDKKLDACLNFKQFIEQNIRNIYIYYDAILQELQHFQKKTKQGKMPKFGCFSGNDDLAMSMIWAFYYLKAISIQNYYEVVKYGVDKFGNQVPLIISSSQYISDEEMKRLVLEIDRYFKSTTKSYNIQMQQLKYEIQKKQSSLMDNFISSRLIQNQSKNSINNNDFDTEQETFQFDGFIS